MDEVLKEMILFLNEYNEVNSILLGGSHSKGTATTLSDYDLFMLIENEQFLIFKNNFCKLLETCPLVDIASFYNYVENWGYIFKTIGFFNEKPLYFDISILPVMRVNEMSLRATNIVLLDKDEVAKKAINNNKDSIYNTEYLEKMRRLDYVKLFGFEYLRFNKSIKNNDYWLAEKSLERMKTYYLHYKRIKENKFANNPHCPEKNFSLEFENDLLQKFYFVSGDFSTLISSSKQVFRLFYDLVLERDILDRLSGYIIS